MGKRRGLLSSFAALLGFSFERVSVDKAIGDLVKTGNIEAAIVVAELIMKRPKSIRTWDGPTPLARKRKTEIESRLSAVHMIDDDVLARCYEPDCRALMNEVDRLEYELALAHRSLVDYKVRSKGRKSNEGKKT